MKFSKIQEFLAESFGTMVLILSGCGSVAMVVHFASNPAVPGFFDQVFGTALLLGMILAVGGKFNAPPGANMAPLMVGLIVVAVGISFGGMYGYAINPARDLGPRLFAVVAGFKNNGLTSGDAGTVYNTLAWLPPVVGPLVGSLLGALAYDLLIGRALMRINELPSPTSGMDPSYIEPEAGRTAAAAASRL